MTTLVAGQQALIDMIDTRSRGSTRPFFVAIDGRSGAGKSTLAVALAETLDVAVIEGDDFYAGGIDVRTDDPVSRAGACIDWTRQYVVLEALASGREAVWRAFDWDAFDGRLKTEPTRLAPKSVVILEGVYAARTELSALLDLRVMLGVPDNVRHARLVAREGTIGPWERQWHEAEEVYFAQMAEMLPFDAVVSVAPEETEAHC